MHKYLISGAVGAGKTTAISAVSDVGPATGVRLNNTTAPIGFDYGEFTLANTRVLLFGAPAERRFDFLFRILSHHSASLVILVDHLARDPLADLRFYTSAFHSLFPPHRTAIAVTHADRDPHFTLAPYRALTAAHVQPLDPRDPVAVRCLFEQLAARPEVSVVNTCHKPARKQVNLIQCELIGVSFYWD